MDSDQISGQEELLNLAEEAEVKSEEQYSLDDSNDEIIDCNNITTYSAGYEIEEILLCSLCNADRGLRVIDEDNWKREVELLQNEQDTVEELFTQFRYTFPDSYFTFTVNGNYVCMTTTDFVGQFDLTNITALFGSSYVNNSELFPN